MIFLIVGATVHCMSRPDAAYDVPDRMTGRQGLAELQRLNPHRQWNFVEVGNLLFVDLTWSTVAQFCQMMVHPVYNFIHTRLIKEQISSVLSDRYG